MTNEYNSAGKTTLTPEVLLTIARMAALEVEGVRQMAPVRGGVNRPFRRGNEGVRMTVEDNNVIVDLFLIMDESVNLRERRPRVTEYGWDKDKDWKKTPAVFTDD